MFGFLDDDGLRQVVVLFMASHLLSFVIGAIIFRALGGFRRAPKSISHAALPSVIVTGAVIWGIAAAFEIDAALWALVWAATLSLVQWERRRAIYFRARLAQSELFIWENGLNDAWRKDAEAEQLASFAKSYDD